MKKGIISFLILAFILSIGLLIFSNKKNIYGNYVIDNILYLSPLSSVSKDYLKEQIKDTIVIINKDNRTPLCPS